MTLVASQQSVVDECDAVGSIPTVRAKAQLALDEIVALQPTLPAWLNGAVGQWGRVPNSKLSSLGAVAGYPLSDTKGLLAYSGLAVWGTELLSHGGGHADGKSNLVAGLQLNTDTPSWRVVVQPSALSAVQTNVSHYADGKPASIHSYTVLQVIGNKMFRMGAPVVWGTSISFPNVDAVDLTTGQWDAKDTWKPIAAAKGGAYLVVKDPRNDNVYTASGSWLQRWSPSTNQHVTIFNEQWAIASPSVGLDTVRNRIYRHDYWNGASNGIRPMLFPLDGTPKQFVTLTGQLGTLFTGGAWAYGGGQFHYDAALDRFVHFKGESGIYLINPDTFEVTIMPTTGAVPPAAGYAAWQYRFMPVPELGGYVFLPWWDQDAYFLRVI